MKEQTRAEQLYTSVIEQDGVYLKLKHFPDKRFKLKKCVSDRDAFIITDVDAKVDWYVVMSETRKQQVYTEEEYLLLKI